MPGLRRFYSTPVFHAAGANLKRLHERAEQHTHMLMLCKMNIFVTKCQEKIRNTLQR